MRSAILLGVLGTAAMAMGQAPGDIAPTVTIQAPKTAVAPGHVAKATLIVTFATGLHGYQNPPSDQFEIPVKVTAKGVTLVKVWYPKGKPLTMAGDTKPTAVYSGTVKIPLDLKVGTKLGTQAFTVIVDYQQCTDSNCFPPAKVEVKGSLKVGKAVKGAKG